MVKNPSSMEEEMVNSMSSSQIESLAKLLNLSKTNIQTIISYRAELLRALIKKNKKYSSKQLMDILHDPSINYKEILKNIRKED